MYLFSTDIDEQPDLPGGQTAPRLLKVTGLTGAHTIWPVEWFQKRSLPSNRCHLSQGSNQASHQLGRKERGLTLHSQLNAVTLTPTLTAQC